MYRRIGRLIQVGIFAALPAGVAFAQTSGSSGSSGSAMPSTGTTTAAPDTSDTRTPVQKKAGGVDDQAAPALPNDTSRPGEIPSPPRDINSGTPGATTDTKSDTKSSDSSDTTTTKKSNDSGDTGSTMERKSTVKHKHIRKSSQATSPNDFDTMTPKPDQKSDLNNLPPDDALNHRLDNKGDLDHKDQLNSDK